MDPNQFLEVIILDSRRNWIYKTCKMKKSVFGISLLLTCYKSKLILRYLGHSAMYEILQINYLTKMPHYLNHVCSME